MSWAEIKKKMKENGLSYDWLRGILYKWYGIVTTNEALRYAVCTGGNDNLRISASLAIEKYERMCNGKE